MNETFTLTDKQTNWFLQFCAIMEAFFTFISYGKVDWALTKVMMFITLITAFSAFFHALYHYCRECKENRKNFTEEI